MSIYSLKRYTIRMLQGTIVEESLTDTSILRSLHVTKSWASTHWHLHQVELTRDEALNLAHYIADGPYYMHFWEASKDPKVVVAVGSDDVLVVFKDRIFDIKHSDQATWAEAVAYGKSIGIPDEQLDFVVFN